MDEMDRIVTESFCDNVPCAILQGGSNWDRITQAVQAMCTLCSDFAQGAAGRQSKGGSHHMNKFTDCMNATVEFQVMCCRLECALVLALTEGDLKFSFENQRESADNK